MIQSQRWFWEVIHCQALPHQGQPNRPAGSPTHDHHTYQLMAHQTHQGGHRNIQARHSSTGHRFLHQWYLATPYYGPKDLLYPKSITQPRLRDLLHPKSTTLPPPVLVNNWFSSVSTHSCAPPPSPRIPVTSPTSFPPTHFSALILQHPGVAWSSSSLLKQQHLPESGILLMTIRAYWLKRRVVTSSSPQN